MKLGIGICACNEEAGIIATLTSLLNSASGVPHPLDWELIVCANGCSDQTVPLVNQWISEHHDAPVRLEVRDAADLVEAQRFVATRLKDAGFDVLAFFDADIMIDIECIPSLIKVASDPTVKAVYARSVPMERPNVTLIERALNQYDLDKQVFSKRRHLHGRAFLVKGWWIPATNPPLLADDIFLSCDLLHRYGPESIAISDDAKVYFHQVSNFTDFYNAYARRNSELSKCLRLFPHFRALPHDQLNRSVLWDELLNEPPSRIFYWIVLLALRKYCQIALAYRFLLLTDFSVRWEPTRTSKKSF